MNRKPLRATDKTRDNHEAAMNDVADSVRRLFVEWGLIADRTARRPWCLDDGLEVIANTPLFGERAAIYAAALEVWTSYCNVQNARESWISILGTVVDAIAPLKALRAETASEAYLGSISNIGSEFGFQGEPPTSRSLGLKTRLDKLIAKLAASGTEAEDIIDALMERRQPGLVAVFYGPNGGGPKPHFAFTLRSAGFTDRQIALIRGDVRPRRSGAEDAEWEALVEKAAREVYAENYRTDARIAKLQQKARAS